MFACMVLWVILPQMHIYMCGFRRVRFQVRYGAYRYGAAHIAEWSDQLQFLYTA